MKLGGDFGYGYGVWVDDEFKFAEQSNIWWRKDWDNSDVLTVEFDYEPGTHHVVIYGGESCCDGLMGMEYQLTEGTNTFIGVSEESTIKEQN